MFLINVDYPSFEEELLIMKRGTGMVVEQPQPVLNADHIIAIQETVKKMPVADHVYRYAERLVRATRPKTPEAHEVAKKFLSVGAGPRASLGLIMAAKAHALVNGQTYVGAHNIAAIAKSILRHRIAANFTAQSEGITTDNVVEQIVASIPPDEPVA
jgi:MoxR-like ATPase